MFMRSRISNPTHLQRCGAHRPRAVCRGPRINLATLANTQSQSLIHTLYDPTPHSDMESTARELFAEARAAYKKKGGVVALQVRVWACDAYMCISGVPIVWEQRVCAPCKKKGGVVALQVGVCMCISCVLAVCSLCGSNVSVRPARRRAAWWRSRCTRACD